MKCKQQSSIKNLQSGIISSSISWVHREYSICKAVMGCDDAEKITNRSCGTRTLKVDLHNKIIEDLIESTGVVPAKYPPKVKLELFSQF